MLKKVENYARKMFKHLIVQNKFAKKE